MASFPAHPVLSCAKAGAWEKRLLTDETAEWAAMRRAGEAVGRAVIEDYREIGNLPAQARILVLVGKGHNGGDALLAAHTILGHQPTTRAVVVLCFTREGLRPLAQRALQLLEGERSGRVEFVSLDEALGTGTEYAVCLDGIFGFQFRLPLDESITATLARVNAYPGIALRAAVDLPTGIGEVSADTSFRADFTYATGIVKAPLLLEAAAASVGRLRYLDLGFFETEAPESDEQVLTLAQLQPLRALRPARSDKRSFGHVMIVGGSRSYPGAVMLAARAALRSGVGLVTAFVPATLAPAFAAAHPEVMWVGCPETKKGGLAAGTADLLEERMGRATALVIGPGLSAEPDALATAQAAVRVTNVPLVFDADALRPEVVELARDRSFVCTPHAGEYERIAPALLNDGEWAAPFGVVVRKGPLTRVTDGERDYFSPFGGPVLARGGSGDVLAGLIGGLLAQQPGDPLRAACRGVVWHGRAADLLARARGQVAVEVSGILEQLGPALHP